MRIPKRLSPRQLAQTVIVTTTLAAPAIAHADDTCHDIVSATVAELSAGAAGWDAAIEALVRSAAGSACVKALSGAYESATAAPAPDVQEDGSEALAAMETVDQSEALVAADTTEDVSEDGKAGWKFLGFEVNAVTGSPGQKPYERKR